MKALKILAFNFIILSLLTTSTFAFTYPDNETNYPYVDDEMGVVDQWSTYTKNCTSYVMWKINQAGLPFHNDPTGPNGSSTTMGNASTWDERAQTIGYTANSSPSVGNPVNWEINSGGAGSAGHVAWVEQVNSDNSIFISEWNWNWGDGKYNERTSTGGNNYIHLLNSNQGSITISNKTVVSGQTYTYNVSNSNSITVLPETRFHLGSNINLKSN